MNYLSHVEYVDENHVALTYQFFNRSRANVMATGRAALAVEWPYTGACITMQLGYERTETEGPVFERLRAKLAGIAAHTGMEKVFRLQGADIYRVHSLWRVDEIEALQNICRRWSSEPWMGALRVVNVRGQTLVVHAESAAALTALRYRREALLAYLREHGRWPLTRLETRVRPALPGRGV